MIKYIVTLGFGFADPKIVTIGFAQASVVAGPYQIAKIATYSAGPAVIESY